MAFTGKLAVITGGGSGMGQAWARRLAGEGATVAILDLNNEGMEATASGFTNVHQFSVDITDAQAVRETFQILKRDWVLSNVVPMRRSCPLVVWSMKIPISPTK